MTDPGGPQRHKLCFLSTLLSQKIPEKSDAVLRCMIAGQPKPEVTWYKNGQAIGEGGNASSYEFFEDQYIHLLHLSHCTQRDAAVYQVSAQSCLGMICCSASIEVEHPPENPQVSPDLGDGRDTGDKCETEKQEQESANQTNEKGRPYKEEESDSPVAPTSSDSSPSKFIHSCPLQILTDHDIGMSSSENLLDVKAMRQTAEVCYLNNVQEIFFNSNNTPENQDVYHCRTVRANVSGLIDGGPGDDGFNEEVFTSGHQNPKTQKYISFSLPLSEAIVCASPGNSTSVNRQPGPQVSSDSESDYELCPEITTYMEAFSDDDLEYLECSDVMTDYTNTLWQRSLQGTDRVFLLESDDEEMEFNQCGLGGCEPFLSEMGRGPQVSDDTRPMDATTGFCGYHSQLQEVGVRSSRASRHSPSPLHAGMTLTLGPHQDGTATATELGRCPLSSASEATENDCPRIQGETRDSQGAQEEFARDNQLTMDKAATEGEVKPLSGVLDKSGLKQGSESLAGERSEERLLGSRRGASRSIRTRWLGTAKKLLLKESALEGVLDSPPKGPNKYSLTQSNQREALQTKAEAPGWNLHFHAEQCAILTLAQQESKTLGPPADSLSKEGGTSFEGEGMLVNNLFETRQVQEQSDHFQMQIRESFRERSSPHQKPVSSVPAGEVSAFAGTTTDFFSNLKEINKENASLAQGLGLESYAQGPQQRDRQIREGHMPGSLWKGVLHEQSAPEGNDENLSPALPSAYLLQDVSTHSRELEALSVAPHEPEDPSLALENVCSGSRGREAACVMECFEAGDQGTCYDTMDPPVGAAVDKYLPQEICPMDFELTEGQSKVSDLCSPDTMLAVHHTHSPEPPQSISEGSKDGNSAESPLLTRTFTWTISQEASQGAARRKVAEVENSPSVLSTTVQSTQEWPSLHDTGGLLEMQPLSSVNSSLGYLGKVGNEGPVISAPVATDTAASHSWLPQERPTTLTTNIEYLQVATEIEDTSLDSVTTKVSPTKYRAVSVSEKDFVDSTGESSSEEPRETHFQFPSNVQMGPLLISSTTECSKEPLCSAPSVPGIGGHVLQLAGEEGFYSNPPLQISKDLGVESQTVDRADSRNLEEDFQERGSETKQRVQPQSPSCQAPLSANDFQESLPPTLGMQEEANVELSGFFLANSREERGLSLDLETNISMVMETTMEDDSQSPSHVPSLSEILLVDNEDVGLGNWEAGDKVKIITLEASDFEIHPSRQVTHSQCKEAEAGLMDSGRDWALSDIFKKDATIPEPDPLGVAMWAYRPQVETAIALDNYRETREGDAPPGDTHWRRLPSQCLDQLRLLESSVDPVEETELHISDSLSEVSETGGKENVKIIQVQEENQLKVDHPAFVDQFLNSPKIMESSVDPTNDKDGTEHPWDEQPELSESIPRDIREGSESDGDDLGQRVEVQPAVLGVPHIQDCGEAIADTNSRSQDQGANKQEETKQHQDNKTKMEVQSDIWQVRCPGEGGQEIPSAYSMSQIQDGSDRSLGEDEFASPTSLSGHLAVVTHNPTEVDIHNSIAEPGSPQYVFPELKERGTIENVPSPSDLTHLSCTSSPEGNVTHFLKLKMEVPLAGETKALSSSSSPTVPPAFISGECESEKAPKLLQDLCQKGSTLGNGKRSREEKPIQVATQTGKLPGARSAVAGLEVVKKKQEASGSGHLAEGMKKKILSRVAALRLRLEEKENVRKSSSLLKKIPKLEKSLSRTDEKREPKKVSCKREGKAPVLLQKIQAEMSPDHSGNVKLSCQFAEIHEDSTIWWTKDSKSIAQVQRSAGDNSSVSLAIVEAGQKDQGLYFCGIKNSYGKVTAEFNLTAEVLKQLSRHMDSKGCEEIEFSQLIFREDFLSDSYFGDRLHGQIATEELHFGEGVHRKAFRSTVMQGLMPVFQPGHACVLKVHNAIAHGTKNSDELVEKNYKLAAQECYVQNTARHYAKIYAAEAQPLEGFGEVPEIIPIFLIHRPENSIPYATVEEELIGEFVKYSIRDGKEINFLRRDSEAGQKCCTFQHWVYQKTSGCLLVTDMQGVGMKLTDVGIATLAKGYKGFKGNCSMTFIDQFKALHQCNKYCKMLGLKSLQSNSQKPKKPSTGKSRAQTNSPK